MENESVKDFLDKLSLKLNEIDNQLKGIKNANKFVVAYMANKSNIYYAVTKNDCNMISDNIHNIMVSPNADSVKLFNSFDEAENDTIETICNGYGDTYYRSIIIYTDYLNLRYDDIAKTIDNIINF